VILFHVIKINYIYNLKYNYKFFKTKAKIKRSILLLQSFLRNLKNISKIIPRDILIRFN